MPTADCDRYEEVLAGGEPIPPDLQEHAAACPECRLLQEAAALAFRPVDIDDEVAAEVARAAAEIARRRRRQWERKRRLVPLAIGAIGYAAGLATFGTAALTSPYTFPLPNTQALLVGYAVTAVLVIGAKLVLRGPKAVPSAASVS